mmetsp:Transcript_31061/g.51550  ORF Transcript_31061/g.51550 Transcript_31061/m.51550 type:complete len:95 (+) Transcript_31061:134-418(+)
MMIMMTEVPAAAPLSVYDSSLIIPFIMVFINHNCHRQDCSCINSCSHLDLVAVHPTKDLNPTPLHPSYEIAKTIANCIAPLGERSFSLKIWERV